MVSKKIALLDTDFTVKTIMSQKDEDHSLMDLLVMYSGYQFTCHEKTVEEIKDHDFCGAYSWTQGRIESGFLKVYSDVDILGMLSSLYGEGAIAFYVRLLKISCDAFSPTRYNDNYAAIDALPYNVNREEFLQKLRACDEAYGKGNGLGEVKLLILLQTLQILLAEEVYVFCSDDRGARAGVFSTASVHCISVLSLFYHLKEWGLNKADAEPYFDSFVKGLPSNQTTFRVYDKGLRTLMKITCRVVFDNIYLDRYEAFGTGFLKEK